MIKLTKEQVVSIHSSLIKASGGTDGVRDEDLLESALESPFQTFDGHDLYPSIIQKAARIGYSLVSNHPFIDGNKRTGIHIMQFVEKVCFFKKSACSQSLSPNPFPRERGYITGATAPRPSKDACSQPPPPLDPVGGYAPATPFLYNQEVYRQSDI
ncbi:death-on-curing family protein [[Eubacterium] siraeum CAG:80]|uniref:Death-on-curing family protein n=1 Tax=[Eubacterium] siraeum CAG:80 TaxID=1263080 RepID=R6SFT7_9FIRM|nr:death-on-curing family protein [[Eubacterium] siraeum CAG:80]